MNTGSDKSLPRVLIIGDSISIGYTPVVQQLLQGKAEFLHSGNVQDTRFGLENLETWLGDGRWDCIHCNWGLWDIVDGAHGNCVVPLEEYRANIRRLLERLLKTRAKLVWATTTPVPLKNYRHRLESDVVAYNAAIRDIMREYGIPINDLHAAVANDIARLQNADDVHFNHEGCEVLGNAVAQAIAAALDLPLSLPSAPAYQGQPVLLCLGDSNGVGWIPALAPLVLAEVVGYHRSGMTIGFDNLGDPALNMLANIETVLDGTIASLGNPVRDVLIFLGTNDCKPVFQERQAESLANLESMVARLRAYAWPLGSTPSITLVMPPPYGAIGADNATACDGRYAGAAKRIKTLGQGIKALGEKINARTIDLHTPLEGRIEKLTTDGIHFTPAGCDEVARLLAAGLDPDLRKGKP